MEITGEALGMARIGLNIEREELAKLLGVSLRTVANWEKNGVPQHRIALVMTKIGTHILAAQENLEYQAWLKTPAGVQRLEDDYQRHIAAERLDSPGSGRLIVSRQAAPNDVLSIFTTRQLLDEVSRRVAVLELNQKASLADQIDPPGEGEDPDYSDMSEQDARDYGLAAKEADPNIGHDELPHEP